MTRIHVRRDLIAKDKKEGTNSKVLGIETSGMKKRYARSVSILGPSIMKYQPEAPLKCGARAWLETKAPVILKK